MDTEYLKKIAEQYNAIDLGKQKMKNLLSFEKDGFRINIYTITGTITVQSKEVKFDKGEIFRNATVETFEWILNNI